MFPRRRSSTRSLFASLAALAVLVSTIQIVGCGGKGEDPLVVYSGRQASIMTPLLEAFESSTGIEVQVQFGASTAALANLVAADGDLTPCDLFLAQDSGHLSALARVGLLHPLPADVLDVVPAAFRDGDGRWIGTSGRVRVLVHGAGVSTADLPARLEDLPSLDPSLRFGWAPGNASFEAHVAGLIDAWGRERTRDWLTALATREPAPVRYSSNSGQVADVARGELDVGWVNHYYLHKARAQDPELAAANYTFPTQGDAGNVLILAGVGVTASEGPRRTRAEALAAFLVSEEAQRYFATKIFEYPLRPGIASATGLPDLDSLGLSDIDVEALTRLGDAKELMDEVGIR